MTPWERTVALAAVGCLIAGAALAQQQIRPPNMKSTPQAPNTPLQAPSYWARRWSSRRSRRRPSKNLRSRRSPR
jgi:hypothetical protein